MVEIHSLNDSFSPTVSNQLSFVYKRAEAFRTNYKASTALTDNKQFASPSNEWVVWNNSNMIKKLKPQNAFHSVNKAVPRQSLFVFLIQISTCRQHKDNDEAKAKSHFAYTVHF